MTTPYLSGSWHVVRLIAELISMVMALGQVLPLLGYPSIERDRYTYVSILHTITSRYPFRLRSPFVLSQPTPSTSNHIHTISDSVFPTRTDVT
ncbi:hypothetical protein EV424DRAFT_1360777 [Suillus variegatus]|nr:hypothetical protein EV424DRAFT_1360777 [Suillus variegatus]